jgi:hypothetical protein
MYSKPLKIKKYAFFLFLPSFFILKLHKHDAGHQKMMLLLLLLLMMMMMMIDDDDD